jgi:hypothetical protein
MSYTLTPVNNGWVLTFIDPDTSTPFTFVFERVEEVAVWLAQRHGEARPRKLIEDWH